MSNACIVCYFPTIHINVYMQKIMRILIVMIFKYYVIIHSDTIPGLCTGRSLCDNQPVY